MFCQLLQRSQVQLAIGNVPAQFVSKVTEISEALELGLNFFVEKVIPFCNSPVCPHVAYVDSLATFGGISELTAKVLSRYGVTAIISPSADSAKHSWKTSKTDAVYLETAPEVDSLETLQAIANCQADRTLLVNFKKGFERTIGPLVSKLGLNL